jgi:uncharacterized membrane protein YjdF
MKVDNSKFKLIFFFTILYLLVFSIIAWQKGNSEFVYYILLMAILISIIINYYQKIPLSNWSLLGLSMMGFVHLLGGSINIGQTRLYDMWFIEGWLKYDNVVHFTNIFIATLIGYSILAPHFDYRIQRNRILLFFLLILIALGLGTLNEVIELFAVLFLNAQERVGDYLNNAFDLFFDLLGSISACLFLSLYLKRKKRSFKEDNKKIFI